MTSSPYERCAAPELFARLHPRLRAYFGPIPPGHVGRGHGVFDVVGTPRRWLWPVLALFARDGVLFPVWERDVPFTVENRPVTVGRASDPVGTAPRTAVRARRSFRFRGGTRTMVDAITAEPSTFPVDGTHVLVDHLGRRGRSSAALRIEVDAGGPDGGVLRLLSTRISIRVGGRDVVVPSAVAPRVVLTERFDDDADRQRVSLVLSAPLLGTLYRYEGSFRYSVVPDDGSDHDRPAHD